MLKSLLRQVVWSWDAMMGCVIFCVASQFAERGLATWFLWGLAITATLGPDLVSFPVFMAVKKFTKVDAVSHRVYSHYPLLFLPGAVVLALGTNQYVGEYLSSSIVAGVVVVGVIVHFVHDAMEDQGLAWLAPFSTIRHQVLLWRPWVVAVPLQIHEQRISELRDGSGNEVEKRAESQPPLILFLVVLILCAAVVLLR